MRRTALILSAFFSLSVLTGCGGGGSSSNPAPASAAPGNAPATGSSAPDVDIIRGAITGFGSVYIGGERFTTDDATFLKDRQPATQDDLAVGMVVKVSGSRSNGSAAVVRYDEDVKGPIDAIDNNRLEVVGQTVVLSGDTRFDDGLSRAGLTVGLFIEVSGYRGASDTIDASYLELSDDPEVEVTGPVRDLDTAARTFRIGSLTVDYSAARLDDLPNGLSEGLLVEAEDSSGAYSPGDRRLIATKVDGHSLLAADVPPVSDDDSNDSGSAGDSNAGSDSNSRTEGEVELEGVIAAVAGSELELSGVTVRVQANTEFRFGERELLQPGTKIEVEGRLDADGVLVADKIKFSRNSARLHGRINDINASTGALNVFGVTVNVGTQTRLEDDRDDVSPLRLEDLMPGDFVELRGLAVGNNIIASRLERTDDDDNRLRGVVSAIDAGNGRIDILGLTLITNSTTEYELEEDDTTVSAATFFDRLVVGQTIVQAQWDGTVSDTSVAVDELEIED